MNNVEPENNEAAADEEENPDVPNSGDEDAVPEDPAPNPNGAGDGVEPKGGMGVDEGAVDNVETAMVVEDEVPAREKGKGLGAEELGFVDAPKRGGEGAPKDKPVVVKGDGEANGAEDDEGSEAVDPKEKEGDEEFVDPKENGEEDDVVIEEEEPKENEKDDCWDWDEEEDEEEEGLNEKDDAMVATREEEEEALLGFWGPFEVACFF